MTGEFNQTLAEIRRLVGSGVIVYPISLVNGGTAADLSGVTLNALIKKGASGLAAAGIICDGSNNLSGIGTVSAGTYNSQTISVAASFTGTLATAGIVGIGASGLLAGAGIYVTTNTMTGTSQYGIVSDPTFSSAATASGFSLYANAHTAAAAFTLTNYYGLYVDNPTKGANSAITNVYGIYVLGLTAGASTNYAIYTNAGLVRIGDATDASSVSTGAIIVSGGIGMAKSLWVGGQMNVTGGDATNFAISISSATYQVINMVTANSDSRARNWRISGGLFNAYAFELMRGTSQGAAASTTCFRLDNADPGAAKTSLWVLEGATPTLRQMTTFNPGNLGVNFTAGQLVAVMV